jgi:hypothetical protein
MFTNLVLLGLIILLGLPVLNYNFKIIFIIFLGYLLIYPDHREMLYNNLGIENMRKNADETNKTKNQSQSQSSQLLVLINEGKNIIKELKQYKKTNSSLYLSVKLSWRKIEKLSNTIIQNPLITYPHHLYSILKDQRKFILSQMSAILINTEPANIKELSSRYERTLPLDVHIRSLIRKISVVMDHILEMVKNNINNNWIVNPNSEISPVDIDIKSPEAYQPNDLDIIQ